MREDPRNLRAPALLSRFDSSIAQIRKICARNLSARPGAPMLGLGSVGAKLKRKVPWLGWHMPGTGAARGG